MANRPIYVTTAIPVNSYRKIFGPWGDDGGEGATYWQTVLTEIRNRARKTC
ncbi:hypothetical protein [Streptomyces sp. NPDC060054]|uniref:hypothetical protein n=1 Tax=unclassified Streptomyces TaxID=2593676 RepID=UPI003673DE4F